MPNQRPNVILILSDSLRADGLGCYGNALARTPSIDALARDGLRFETCYATSPLCVPSRSQLFSGMYCHETGNLQNQSWQYHVDRPVEVDGVCLAPEVPTLAEALTANGYFTAHLGKNHFYPRHNTLGFQHVEQCDFYGRWVHEKDDYYLFLKRKGYAHLFKDAFGRVDVIGTGGQGVMRKEFGYVDRLCPYVSKLPAELQHTPWLGERARAFLRHHPMQMPFFLVVSFYAPHDPYCVSAPHDELIDWRTIPLPPQPKELPPSSLRVGERSLFVKLPEEMWKKNVAFYLANVSLIDREVGLLVECLNRQQLAENTLLIITSDHGDALGEHGIWGKNLLFDSCARVPLLFHHGSGEITMGTTKETATLLDLFPTILDQTRTPMPHSRLAGHALRLDRVQTATDERIIIGELANSRYPQYFVRKGDWKLIYLEGYDECELYHLETDPMELTNLAAIRTENVLELRSILRSWLEREKPYWRSLAPGIEKVDGEKEARLSHL